jgi:choline dehydrogenase
MILSHPLNVQRFRGGTLFIQTLPPKGIWHQSSNASVRVLKAHKEIAGVICNDVLMSDYHPIGTCSMMPEGSECLIYSLNDMV